MNLLNFEIMIVKYLVFICSLYVVKAYVAVNIYTDDVETKGSSLSVGLERSSVISDCSPLACAQLCRRIGLKGGVCVHGRCKCDMFIEMEDVETQRSSLSVGLERSSVISDCSPLACAQLCRRIGLKGGVCVHGRCKCDMFIEMEDDTHKSLTRCDWSSCDRGCRSIGYSGGSCFGSECRCNSRHSTTGDNIHLESADAEVQVMKLEKPSPMISECNPLACDRSCRGIFTKGGACVHGKCKCDIIIDTEESNEIPPIESDIKDKESEKEVKEKVSVGSCSNSTCSMMCRKIGFKNGICDTFKDACRCY